MVPINNNYHRKKYLQEQLFVQTGNNIIVDAFITYLGLKEKEISSRRISNHEECALNGFYNVNNEEKLRHLFKCDPEVEEIPMPWLNNVICLFGIKLAVILSQDLSLTKDFNDWASKSLKKALKEEKFDIYERTLANFILDEDISNKNSSSIIILFLHYKGLYDLDKNTKKDYINSFWETYVTSENNPSSWFIAILIYVFDNISKEQASVPPNNWSLNDLTSFLKKIPASLNCWTWEDKAKTKNSSPVKWYIENEYHVQNLLYVLLAPIFAITHKEFNLPQQGHKNPRADLYIPEINTIIEVKYRKDKAKKFTDLTDELAADRTLYTASNQYKNCKLIAILWDNLASIEEHDKFILGVCGLGFDDCIVISSPSCMRNNP